MIIDDPYLTSLKDSANITSECPISNPRSKRGKENATEAMHILELQFGEAIGNSTGLCIDYDISVPLKARWNQKAFKGTKMS